MEEKLLKIFKLADSLNEKQDKVYAQIIYTADKNKTVEISIISKENYSYIERCQFNISQNTLLKLDNLIELFKNYIDDAKNK